MQKSIYSAENNLLCEMLKNARLQQKLTQVQLAERLGKPQSFVAKIERGERRLDVVEFIWVVESIGLVPTQFFRKFIKELQKLQ